MILSRPPRSRLSTHRRPPIYLVYLTGDTISLLARNYMRALEMYRLEQERQSKMKTAAQVKEEREQKLATMTEEEKEIFYEEEKEQKKQEWVKKQVSEI